MSSGSSLADSVSAGDAVRERPLLLAEGRGQGADPLVDVMILVPPVGEAVPGHMHRRVGPQGAREDPYQRDTAHVGIAGGLHDLRDQRAVGIAGRLDLPGRALGGGDGGRLALQGGGEAAGDQFEQFDRAEALSRAVGGGGGGQHGVEDPAGDGAFQVVDESRDVDLLTAEIAVHEGLVLALRDDPLDEPVAGLLDGRQLLGARLGLLALTGGVVEQPPRQQSGQPGHGRVPVRPLGAVQRQIERQYGIGVVPAERLRADTGHLLEVRPRGLQVGHHDRPGHADRRALLPHHAGRAVHAVRGRDDEKGRVRRSQTGPEFPDEVGVSGGVQQIDLVLAPFDGDERELHRALLPVFYLVVVGDGAAVLHTARPVHRPRRQRESLHQRRLARTGVADQHHIPYGRGVVGRRSPAGGSGMCVRLVAHGLPPVHGEVTVGADTRILPGLSSRGTPAVSTPVTPAVSFELSTRVTARPYGGRDRSPRPRDTAGRCPTVVHARA
jgi:hypothetical protein